MNNDVETYGFSPQSETYHVVWMRWRELMMRRYRYFCVRVLQHASGIVSHMGSTRGSPLNASNCSDFQIAKDAI